MASNLLILKCQSFLRTSMNFCPLLLKTQVFRDIFIMNLGAYFVHSFSPHSLFFFKSGAFYVSDIALSIVDTKEIKVLVLLELF